MAHPVTWFQISGRDGAALEDFYKKIFDWKMTPSPDGTMQMISPEAGGIPGGVGASRDGTHSVAVYANVDDIAAQLKKIQDAGGEVAMPPMELPEGMGWIAGFTDPAGNWFGLWQPGKQAESPPRSAKKKTAKKAPPKAAAKKAAPKPAKAAPKPAKAAPKPAKSASKSAKSSKAAPKAPLKPAKKVPAKKKSKGGKR